MFAALACVALALLHRVPGLGVPDAEYVAFYTGGSEKVLVTLGLNVVPFAGIAFLWHMTATRALLGTSPVSVPAMPGLLQLVSGVVFICVNFAATAAVGGVALLSVFSVDPLPSVDVARALAGVGYGLTFVFGVRMAGMYMITTNTLARKAGAIPGWLAVLGYLAAAFLLVSTTFHPAVLLIFPAWVLVTSVVLLRADIAPSSPTDGS